MFCMWAKSNREHMIRKDPNLISFQYLCVVLTPAVVLRPAAPTKQLQKVSWSHCWTCVLLYLQVVVQHVIISPRVYMIQLLFRFDAVFLKLLDHPTAWWHDVVNQLNPVKIYIWVGVDAQKKSAETVVMSLEWKPMNEKQSFISSSSHWIHF